MIFKIGLPRILDELFGLETDSEVWGEQGRPPIIVKPPPNHECSCTCSSLSMNTTWSLVYNPIIII